MATSRGILLSALADEAAFHLTAVEQFSALSADSARLRKDAIARELSI